MKRREVTNFDSWAVNQGKRLKPTPTKPKKTKVKASPTKPKNKSRPKRKPSNSNGVESTFAEDFFGCLGGLLVLAVIGFLVWLLIHNSELFVGIICLGLVLSPAIAALVLFIIMIIDGDLT
jgi:hypothetical protein